LQEWSQDRIEELAALHAAQQLEALEAPGWAEIHQVERHKRKKGSVFFEETYKLQAACRSLFGLMTDN
jgi:hypothetical protein